MQKTEKFENAYVVNYQGLQTFIQNHKHLRFRYVIADECHYFLQDSTFSDCTGPVLSLLPKEFKNSIRIYISATLESVLPFIIDAELHKFQINSFNFMYLEQMLNLTIYTVKNNYSKIDLKFFENQDELLRYFKFINGKGIIFCESVAQCKNISETLGDSLILTSEEFHKNFSKYKHLMEKECFEEKYLVSTSVFSNGNNINDLNVKDVAIFFTDPVEILQMDGRRRIKYNNEADKYSVYIYVPSLEDIERKINNIEQIQYEIEKCKRDQFHLMHLVKDGTDDLSLKIRKIVTITDKCEYAINSLAEDKLYLDHAHLEYIYELINESGKDAYCTMIAELFGKTFNSEMYFSTVEERIKELTDKINSYDFPMNKEEFEDFSTDITEIRINLMGKTSSDNTGGNRKPLKERALNNRFEELGIPVEIYKDNGLYYKKTLN